MSCYTCQHIFSLTSDLGVLSHCRSSESQLRELSQLAPTISMSQTQNDLGFSGGYLSGGQWSQFAWSHGTDVYSWRPSRETSNFFDYFKIQPNVHPVSKPSSGRNQDRDDKKCDGSGLTVLQTRGLDRALGQNGKGRVAHFLPLRIRAVFISWPWALHLKFSVTQRFSHSYRPKPASSKTATWIIPGPSRFPPPPTRPFHSGLPSTLS